MSEHWPARLHLPSPRVVNQAAAFLLLVLDYVLCVSARSKMSKQKVAGALLQRDSALLCQQVYVFLLKLTPGVGRA